MLTKSSTKICFLNIDVSLYIQCSRYAYLLTKFKERGSADFLEYLVISGTIHFLE